MLRSLRRAWGRIYYSNSIPLPNNPHSIFPIRWWAQLGGAKRTEKWEPPSEPSFSKLLHVLIETINSCNCNSRKWLKVPRKGILSCNCILLEKQGTVAVMEISSKPSQSCNCNSFLHAMILQRLARLGIYGRKRGRSPETQEALSALSGQTLEGRGWKTSSAGNTHKTWHLKHFQTCVPSGRRGPFLFWKWPCHWPTRAGHGIPSNTGGLPKKSKPSRGWAFEYRRWRQITAS